MTGPVRVLFVGRDEQRVDSVADDLSTVSAAVTVEGTADPDEAVVQAAAGDADCVLTEHDLEGGDGLALLSQVRDARSSLPVVLWPRTGDERLASDAVAAGVTDYVPQPTDPDPATHERLIERIRDCIDEEGRPTDDGASAADRDEFRAIARGVPDVVITIDADSRVRFVNDAVEEVFGYQPAELIGESLTTLMPERLEEPHQRALDAYVETGEKQLDWSSVEISGERRDGEEFPLEVSFSEFDRDGTQLFTGVLRDISDRRRRTETMAQLHEASRDLMSAETPADIAAITVETARTVLDLPITSCFLYDEETDALVPAASTPDAEQLLDDVPTFTSGDSLTWETFVDGDLRQFDDVSREDDVHNADTPTCSELQVPIGEYGVLVTGTTAQRELDRYDTDLAQLLAANVEAALGRAGREALLRERERELHESERRFRQIAGNLNAVIWMSDDRQSELLYVSPGHEALWGSSRADLWTDREAFLSIVHEEDRQVIADAIDTTLRQEHDIEYRIHHPEKGLRWIHERAVPVDTGGEGARLVGIATDVTERKEREKELEEYEAIFWAVRDRVYVLDENGRFTLVNDPLLSMLGYRREELIGRHVSAIADEDIVETGRTAIDRLIGSGDDSVTIEVDVQTAAGEAIPCEVEIAALDDGSEFTGSVGVVRDISGRKRVKAQLQRERDRLSELFENIPDAVVEVDFQNDDPIVRSVNDAFEEVFGYDAEAVVGESLNDHVVPPDRRDRSQSLDDKAREGDRITTEVRRQTSDGIRYFLFRGIPFESHSPDDDHDLAGFGIYTDITTQKRRQRQLQVLNRVLRHNLRNDMNVISGYAELLADEVDDHLVEATRAITEKAGEVAGLSEKARMVETTLDDGEEHRETVDVTDLIEAVTDEYEDVTFSFDLPERTPVDAHHLLVRALDNVVENAVEHGSQGPDSSSVTVEVTPDDESGFVDVSVRDDGPGIPAAEREVLTGEREISQLDHGSGLGLWLVNWIVTASGGGVEFGENDPRGSVVTLRLRAADE
jgi:PAS domain S-box-containing protein